MRIGGVDFHVGDFGQPVMRCHLAALIVGKRQTTLRLDPIQHMTEYAERRLSTGVVYQGRYSEQGGALHQRTDRGAVLRALDEKVFTEPGDERSLHLRRQGVNVDYVRNQ